MSSEVKSVTVLGSTGSIGQSTVDLLTRNPDKYRVEALTANTNIAALTAQAQQLKPKMVAVADPSAYGDLKDALSGTGILVGAGPDAIVEAAERSVDWVMASIVGAAGLKPTLAAIRQGATIGLANKECLVCAGDLMMREVAKHDVDLLPVDSEHSAIYQVLDKERPKGIERIVLTASGGPFRQKDMAFMAEVTPEQAKAHPKWDMGAKISVDSATMMNKGLEIIEAHHLFNMPNDKIGVLVHPDSIIHSMVEYVDGSVLAQLGAPDMRTPIAYALAWPERIETPVDRLDLAKLGQLTFEEPDEDRFPALRLARHALQKGGVTPTILNAANEVAVAQFLDRQIGFLDIPYVVERTMEKVTGGTVDTIEDVMEADTEARQVASGIGRRSASAA